MSSKNDTGWRTFMKVSALVHVLCKGTVASTFQYLLCTLLKIDECSSACNEIPLKLLFEGTRERERERRLFEHACLRSRGHGHIHLLDPIFVWQKGQIIEEAILFSFERFEYVRFRKDFFLVKDLVFSIPRGA
jgi:hypothetical protein